MRSFLRRELLSADARGRCCAAGGARRVRIGGLRSLLVSVAGVVVGTLLFAHADLAVGPFRAEMSVSPSITGGTEVDIPPLGSLHLDSHDGPLHLKVNLGSLDQERTEALIDDPAAISAAGQNAVDDVTNGVLRLGLRALGASVVTALLLSALVFRNIRRVAWSGVLALVVTGGSMGLAAATVRPDAISEPRYEGLLVNAPAVVGDARRIADNYGRYADQLQQLVSNVSRIYATVSTLPVYEPAGNTTRILHVSDLHLNPTAWRLIRTVVQQFDIDAVVDTGDIVDWGSSAETAYVVEHRQLGAPYIYVRGNHDSAAIEAAVARQPNARRAGQLDDHGGVADHRRHRRPASSPRTRPRNRRWSATPTGRPVHRCCRPATGWRRPSARRRTRSTWRWCTTRRWRRRWPARCRWCWPGTCTSARSARCPRCPGSRRRRSSPAGPA